MIRISTPLLSESILSLKAGDEILLSGTVYTARDAAHKRLVSLIDDLSPLPVDLSGQILYYTGPAPARPRRIIGSAGPTTSSRMDRYTPSLIKSTGLAGVIGKGNRSEDVVKAFRDYKCVYFAATGGAGALLSQCITRAEIVCYEDLGPEAIYKLEVKDFPLFVAIDCGEIICMLVDRRNTLQCRAAHYCAAVQFVLVPRPRSCFRFLVFLLYLFLLAFSFLDSVNMAPDDSGICDNRACPPHCNSSNIAQAGEAFFFQTK